MKSFLLLSLFSFINFACAMENGWEGSCEQQCLWNAMGTASFCHTAYILRHALIDDEYYPSKQERQLGWASVVGGTAFMTRRLVGVALDRKEDRCCDGLLFVPCGCEHSYLLNRLVQAWRGKIGAEKKNQ
ncbi:TPA: hypothetical protein DIC20_03635 [Candidatus Dependentiae bacterium]|nr:MAG: hypothetical protein US03_C0001G0114 [candidate division TM6 bacterium GW2011_GWF2_36_131]KKQ03750.1 MAG: hypothetical protein US13_C0001G0090 [candidate division TM6 bacterium GW2011_GWE2_36_25]KKQ19894.1 MAG: hypothetical protein US32_C0003G0011 [candidate division TM6 bacterium GW2011_GWA2_36_9]HBR70517.1 hypothetical protein [Candidatus Dependentiae bacterium]HCU00767.1 hypothetical protein [Candidatus Dependentiae bacterium]